MEKLFSYFWKNEAESRKVKKGFVSLNENLLRFQFFTQLAAPTGSFSDLGGSLWAVGFVESELLVPKDICWTTDSDLNLQLTELLILKSIAIQQLQIIYPFQDRERIAPRLYILTQMPGINQWLDKEYPRLPDFEKNILSEFEKYSPRKNDILYKYWKLLFTARSDQLTSHEKADLDHRIKNQKRNDIPPFYLHATVPLPYRRLVNLQDPKTESSRKNQSLQDQTQKKRHQKEYIENAEPSEKGAVNPVLHSFEKMDTAEDYDGGRRIESGDDDLDSHESALDEVELNRFTTSGDASSLYQQDSPHFKAPPQNSAEPNSIISFQYPEWSEKENRYLKSFCTVYPSVPESCIESALFKNLIAAKYKNVIRYWKNKFNALVHIPLWQNKLYDGADIDIDNYIRLSPELKSYSGRPKIYSEKQKLQKEMSILILADVSYSTDTWVNGRKVIDIVKDCISISSFLFEDLFERVSVAITNSETRKRIHYKELKKMNEDWVTFFQRSHEIRPHEYTRLGPAIRHATQTLIKENSPESILILITDGKPTDLDPYEGTHGQKDVKKSLHEATVLGLRVLTLTVSDFDPVILQKIFERPCSVETPDDFCREIFRFIREICSKNR
jgi:nitric oxide reductase NorD protein